MSCRPRSWANFTPFYLFSHLNSWAHFHPLANPTAPPPPPPARFSPPGEGEPRRSASAISVSLADVSARIVRLIGQT
jgi:hypothetical protein